MRSIAIMNQKGGVGKTTTAVNLGAALAAMGRRVCLVDLDPQAHATLHLGVEPKPDEPSIYQVLSGGATIQGVWRQAADNLWLVPSSSDLVAAEVELVGTAGREVVLRDKLQADPPPVDFLLVDCPPSLGLLTISALAAVGEVVIPLQPHFFALHGLSKLLETIEAVASRLNGPLRLSGVVLCLYDAGTRLATEVSQDVEQFFRNGRARSTPWAEARLFESRVRRNIRLAEAPGFGQSIFQYAADSHGAEDYRRLAEEIGRGDDAEGERGRSGEGETGREGNCAANRDSRVS
jgi:chromosome partitioning protein